MNKNTNKCAFCGGLGVTQLVDYDNLFFCGKCRTASFSPLPCDKELADFYENHYWEMTTTPENISAHHLAPFYTDIIKKHNSTAKTICDIGCGYGALLKGFAEQGFSVTGIEYSKIAVNFIKEKLKLTAIQGSIKDIKLNFDVISLRHMLEHSSTPFEDLKNAAKHLNKNGLFIISVPHFDSLASKIFKNKWEWYSHPNHLFYFNLDSFKHFASVNNLEIIYTETRHGDAKSLSTCLDKYIEDGVTDKGVKDSLIKMKTLVEKLEQEGNYSLIETLDLGEELTVIMKIKD